MIYCRGCAPIKVHLLAVWPPGHRATCHYIQRVLTRNCSYIGANRNTRHTGDGRRCCSKGAHWRSNARSHFCAGSSIESGTDVNAANVSPDSYVSCGVDIGANTNTDAKADFSPNSDVRRHRLRRGIRRWRV